MSFYFDNLIMFLKFGEHIIFIWMNENFFFIYLISDWSEANMLESLILDLIFLHIILIVFFLFYGRPISVVSFMSYGTLINKILIIPLLFGRS